MSDERTLLDEMLEERKRVTTLPVLDVRWYVLEIRDAVTDDLGVYTPPEMHRVSDYFKFEHEAVDWLKNHTASYGSKLVIKKQFLREFKERRWSSY